MRPVKTPLRGAVCPAENAAAARCVPTAMAQCVPTSPAASCRNPCMTAYLFILANIYAVPPENKILLSAAPPGDGNGKTRPPNLQLPLRHSEPVGVYHVYPRHMEHFTRARPFPREVQRMKGRESEPCPPPRRNAVFAYIILWMVSRGGATPPLLPPYATMRYRNCIFVKMPSFYALDAAASSRRDNIGSVTFCGLRFA